MNIESKILMNMHKIEKAMSMPNRYSIFSQKIIREIIQDLEINSLIDKSILNEACRTIIKYRNCLDVSYLENKNIIIYINKFLDKSKSYIINNKFIENEKSNNFNYLENIVFNRHSVRNYTKEKVSTALIYKAVDIANSLPSACNRQACSLIIIENKIIKKDILSLQTGNKGFNAPTLAAVIINKNVFTQENEDNVLIFHAGSFTSGFIIALQSLNISSCILNWYVDNEKNIKAKQMLNLSQTENEIAVLIFIGYSNESNEAYSFKKRSNELIAIIK